jgi:tetratricopeptide (TPR) repeat protein
VPGTVILDYLRRMRAREAAMRQGIDPESLRPVLAMIEASDAPMAEIPSRIEQFVREARAHAAQPVRPSNDGADIEATIGASREKLRALDAAGARDLLQAKIAEEEEARTRRLLPLLRERAEIERLTFDYEAAKKTLAEITNLAPDDVWGWIELGDLWELTGSLERAAGAYQSGEAVARRTGNQRDLSVSHNKIGDVQVAQGDLAAGLTSYQASLAIRDRLTKADPGNAGWQRDLSVSHNKIGDVQVAQGDLAAALTSYQASLAIADRLAKADPGNTGWQRDLSVSHNKIGDVQVAQGDLAAGLTSYQASHDIFDRLAKANPGNAGWQRDLSVSHERIGDVQTVLGETSQAIGAFERALHVYRGLQAGNPGDTPSLVYSVVPLWRLGRLKGGQEGRVDLEAALKILKQLAGAGRLDANRSSWIEEIQNELYGVTSRG